MAVTFDLPADVENALRDEIPDLESATKEAALVELYRQGRISQDVLSRALGMTRVEVEGVLKKHGVIEDLPTEGEYQAALARLRKQPAK